MPDCEQLSSYTENTVIITKDNIGEIIPDKFDLSPGTQVTVSCNNGYRLVGTASFSCTSAGLWSYPKKPYCTDVPEEEVTTSLDQDTKIMIGVVCAIAGLIVLVLIIMMITLCLRDRRKRRERREFWNSIRNGRRPPPDYRGRDGPSTIDMEMYSRSRPLPPPPPYDGRRSEGYKGYYDDIKRSRKNPPRDIDELSVTEKKPYVRDWVRRSSQYGPNDDYTDRSGYGSRIGRDPYFWRDAMF
ncbi:Complement receptor type [Mactra antiquata]